MLKGSLHFIPAHNDLYINKISNLKTTIVFDLEDSVPHELKGVAREKIERYCSLHNKEEFYVRINPINSQYYQDDLDLLNNTAIQNIIVPKVGVSELQQLEADFKKDLHVLVLIESFESYHKLADILEFESVRAASLGMEDMLADIPYMNDSLSSLINFLKLDFMVKVKAARKIPVDTIMLEYQDMKLMKAECELSRSMGYEYKFSIHPNQIPIIDSVLSPTQEELSWANGIQNIASKQSSAYSKVGDVLISPPKVSKANAMLSKTKEN